MSAPSLSGSLWLGVGGSDWVPKCLHVRGASGCVLGAGVHLPGTRLASCRISHIFISSISCSSPHDNLDYGLKFIRLQNERGEI